MLIATLDTTIDRWIPVIVAGMPAVMALLKIRELTIHINSRMDRLLAVTAELARVQGAREGNQEARLEAEQKARDLVERTNAGDTSKPA